MEHTCQGTNCRQGGSLFYPATSFTLLYTNKVYTYLLIWYKMILNPSNNKHIITLGLKKKRQYCGLLTILTSLDSVDLPRLLRMVLKISSWGMETNP